MTMNVTIHRANRITIEKPHYLKEVETWERRIIIVEQVSITDFNFGEQFNIAIENKVTAEQNALTEQNKLKVIEFQAQQKIAEAEGTRNSTIAQAQGQAEATRLNAEAEAYRVQLVQEQLSRSPQYTEYIKATRWTGTLPQFYMTGSNNPLIMTLPNMTG